MSMGMRWRSEGWKMGFNDVMMWRSFEGVELGYGQGKDTSFSDCLAHYSYTYLFAFVQDEKREIRNTTTG